MVGKRFGPSAESRAFHIDVGAAVVNAGFERTGRLQQDLPKFFTDGIGEGDMTDDAAAKKSVGRRLFGSVDELIRQKDVAWAVLGLEGANRTGTDNPGHTKLLQGPDVGAVIQFTRQNPVTAPVAR